MAFLEDQSDEEWNNIVNPSSWHVFMPVIYLLWIFLYDFILEVACARNLGIKDHPTLDTFYLSDIITMFAKSESYLLPSLIATLIATILLGGQVWQTLCVEYALHSEQEYTRFCEFPCSHFNLGWTLSLVPNRAQMKCMASYWSTWKKERWQLQMSAKLKFIHSIWRSMGNLKGEYWHFQSSRFWRWTSDPVHRDRGWVRVSYVTLQSEHSLSVIHRNQS